MCKSRDTGNSDMPKRSSQVLPLSEKVRVLNKLRNKRILKVYMLRLLICIVRMNHLASTAAQ